MLEIRKLNKRFSPIRAVRDISFTVEKGEVNVLKIVNEVRGFIW